MRIGGYIGKAIIAGLFSVLFFAPTTAKAAWKSAPCTGANTYLVGLSSRSGVWIDRLGPVCGVWDPIQARQVDQDRGPMLATSTGGSRNPDALCPVGSAVSRIQYDLVSINGQNVAEHIFLHCKTIAPPHKASDRHPYIPSAGNGTPDNKPTSCFLGVAPCVTAFSEIGPTDDSPCQNGLANGFRANVGEFVGRIELACRPFAEDSTTGGGTLGGGAGPGPQLPTGPLSLPSGGSFPLGPQGGGQQANVFCPTGMAMVGAYGVGKNGNLDRLDVRCASFAGRVWSGGIKSAGTLGKSSAVIGTMRTCTAPNAVTAIDGDVTSHGGIAGIRLHCGAELLANLGRNAPNNLETWSHATITCGPGNVARGIYGWVDASGAIKSFGLHCMALSAFGTASAGGAGGTGSGGTPSGGGGGASGVTINDFLGTWHVTANTGYSYTMTLFLSGGVVRGSYDTGRANGQVSNGVLSGGTLSMDLSQSAVIVGTGKGTFHFADPLRMMGTWTMGPFSGTWTAVR